MSAGEGIRIRRARPEDLERIAGFQRRMAKETEGRDLDLETLTHGVRSVLEDPEKGFYLVAEKEGDVRASMLLTREWSDWRGAWFWWIQSVYVETRFRETGLYRALHEEARRRAREAGGVCGLRLYVEAGNRNAREVYRRVGMEESSYRIFEEDWSGDPRPRDPGRAPLRARALSIAGSDPSGGAGIQADLKTFHQHGVYGEAAISLLTVQDTEGVRRVETLPPDFLAGQVLAVLDDLPPTAVKTGALPGAPWIEAVASCLEGRDLPLIVDPVLAPSRGKVFGGEAILPAFRDRLLPLATLVTPNLEEAAALAGRPVEDRDSMSEAARRIADLGPGAVWIKGGHLDGPILDLLFHEGEILELPVRRIENRAGHGTGCVLSAAVTARLALGEDLVEAVREAQTFVHRALERAPGGGKGVGPLDLFAPI